MSHDLPNPEAAPDLYQVVVNHEEQYSIWPDGRDVPAGWSVVGARDTKERCLETIARTWTDMRPLSLRKAMAEAAKPGGGTPP